MTASNPALEVPRGVALAPDEKVIASGSFMLSNLLFFIHWQMSVTSKRLVGQVPNTILGIIPLGSTQVSYPLAAIAGVTSRTRYSAFWFIVGALLLLGGIGGRNAVVIILGVLALLASFRAEIAITNSGGGQIGHAVGYFGRSAASAFVQQVNSAIATHAHQAPTVVSAPVTDRQAPSASDALSELARLRDAGHLNADEYEAKRREIIGRL